MRELLAAQTAADSWVPPISLESPGEEARRVGPFELERLIGRGGMGAVYLAHRADGQFDQKVAVKLMGLPFEIESFRERFRRERQILAGLNHPNITRLLDGGVTSGGELYLAMEYVDGIGIDRYCQQPGRSVKDRLNLFRKVCDAVQYAHQNLIIHRDIKPSNILVTPDGTPKLLDFGTATLVGDADTTRTGMAPMTQSYASPEQLRGEGVTTLSDVYSLGVVLFEILTGTKNAIGDMTAGLGGDLKQILNKARAPETALRYSSPEQLSEDLRRYLAGEPVIAHPPGLVYRATKFVRRYQLAVAGTALLLLTLAVGVGATLRAERRAERRFNEVWQLAHYVVFERPPGSVAQEKQVFERSLTYLESVSSDPSSDRHLRLALAAGYGRLASVLGNPWQANLGDRQAALKVYAKALALTISVAAQDPRDPTTRSQLASIRLQYGGTQLFGGDRAAGQAQVGKRRRGIEEPAGRVAGRPGYAPADGPGPDVSGIANP